MPSSRGASFHRPEAERRRARRARRRLVLVESLSASLLLSLSVSAQGLDEAERRAPSAEQAASAPSAERPRVILLVRTENDEGVMNRVRAELRASAWQILELRVDERLAQLPLGKLAAQQAVRAAVRFDAAGARIELWIFRPAGNVEEAVAGGGQSEDDAIVALRITEELRARGLELGPESAPADGASAPGAPAASENSAPLPEKAPSPLVPRPAVRAAASHASAETVARPLAHGLWLELGPALSGGPGGLGPSVAGWASVRLELGPRWSGAILGLIPIVPQRPDGPEGSASVSTYWLGASVDVAFLRTPRWQTSVGMGGAWARSEMRGAASTGYVGDHASVGALMPLARASAQLKLGERWRLGLSGLGGVALPEVSVKFGERVAGRWGRPALLATLDLHWLAVRLPTSTDPSPSR